MEFIIFLPLTVIGYFVLYLIIRSAVTNGILDAHDIINNSKNKSGSDEVSDEDEVSVDEITNGEFSGERDFVKTDCPVCHTKHEAGLSRCPFCDHEYK